MGVSPAQVSEGRGSATTPGLLPQLTQLESPFRECDTLPLPKGQALVLVPGKGGAKRELLGELAELVQFCQLSGLVSPLGRWKCDPHPQPPAGYLVGGEKWSSENKGLGTQGRKGPGGWR